MTDQPLGKRLNAKLKKLDDTMMNVKTSKDERNGICEVLGAMTQFRSEGIKLSADIISCITTIEYALEYYEEQKEMYITAITKLCTKYITSRAEKLLSFKLKICVIDSSYKYL